MSTPANTPPAPPRLLRSAPRTVPDHAEPDDEVVPVQPAQPAVDAPPEPAPRPAPRPGLMVKRGASLNLLQGIVLSVPVPDPDEDDVLVAAAASPPARRPPPMLRRGPSLPQFNRPAQPIAEEPPGQSG